ncbi:MAG: hypothetical protein JKY37_34245 [Nannocystaceae bacterium]|nr:hypothetical protein [Nannocystaceae bacterium]
MRFQLGSLLAVCLIVGTGSGCVWEPSDQAYQSRTTPFDIRGWAQGSNKTITVQAFNFSTNGYDVISAMTTTSSAAPNWANPSIYHYATPSFTLPSNYWVPPGAGCETVGMASLRVYEQGALLTTFDSTEHNCVTTEVWNGAHPANAAQNCGYGNTLVLFSPPTC